MLEELAKAIAESEGCDWDVVRDKRSKYGEDGLSKEEFRSFAGSVLERLREPSEAMIEAGFKARERGMTMGESATATFQAMIDVVLEGKPHA